MIHMGVARKWHFSTSGGAANLGGVFGDLFENRGSGIPLLGITSLFMHKLTGLNLYHICLGRLLAVLYNIENFITNPAFGYLW